MDANSKFGPTIIPGDPHEQTINGKKLLNILNRHNLILINGTEECDGLITRSRLVEGRLEQSIIDFVVISSDLIPFFNYMNHHKIHSIILFCNNGMIMIINNYVSISCFVEMSIGFMDQEMCTEYRVFIYQVYRSLKNNSLNNPLAGPIGSEPSIIIMS